MRNVLGVLLMVAGAALAIYVGGWLMFVGGIVQIVDAIKATPVEGVDIAIGIIKIMLAGAAGALTAVVAIFPGYAMLKS